MAGHVTLSDVNEGRVDLDQLLKLNALMDATAAADEAAMKKAAG